MIRDHTHNTLNLTVSTKNKVVEMMMNMENILMPYMMHLHKQTREVIHNDLLKATLTVSRLHSSKSKLQN